MIGCFFVCEYWSFILCVLLKICCGADKLLLNADKLPPNADNGSLNADKHFPSADKHFPSADKHLERVSPFAVDGRLLLGLIILGVSLCFLLKICHSADKAALNADKLPLNADKLTKPMSPFQVERTI